METDYIENMRFEVTIVGRGSAQPVAGRNHAGQVVNLHEQYYLIDCGEGTQARMREFGLSTMRLNAIFLTHLHGDHIYGIFPLLSSLALSGRKTPIKIFAPHPFGELLESVKGFLDERYSFEVQYEEVNTREHQMIYENKVMEVWTIPLRHRIPTAGYLFKEKRPKLNIHKDKIDKHGLGIAQIVAAKRGEDVELECGTVIANQALTYQPYEPRSYAYCSDTLRSGKVTELVRGVDLLYHEATFDADSGNLARTTGHTTTRQAAEIAQEAEVGQLMLGHFSSRYRNLEPLLSEGKKIFQNTIMPEEGETISIPAVKYE